MSLLKRCWLQVWISVSNNKGFFIVDTTPAAVENMKEHLAGLEEMLKNKDDHLLVLGFIVLAIDNLKKSIKKAEKELEDEYKYSKKRNNRSSGYAPRSKGQDRRTKRSVLQTSKVKS
jgi:hypothetical protein